MKEVKKAKNFIIQHSWYTVGSNVTNLLNYANTILIGRILGPSGVGDLSSFGAYLALFGIPMSIVGTFVTQTSSVERYAMSAIGLIRKNIQSYFVSLVVVLVMSFFLKSEISRITHLSLVSSTLLLPDLWLAILIIPLGAIALGREKYKLSALISLFSACMKIMAIPIILITHIYSSDVAIVTLTVGQMFATLLLYRYVAQDFEDAGPSPTWQRVFRFAIEKQFIYTVLGSASMILIANVDIVLARRIFDPKTAGIYATWSLLSKVIFFTLGPILTISFVKQAKKSHSGSSKLDSSVVMILIFCILSILPIYLCYQYIAPYFLKIIFGSKFDELYAYLGVSGIFGTLTLLLNHLANTHIAQHSWHTIWTAVCVGGLVVVCYTIPMNIGQYYVAVNTTVLVAVLGLCTSLYFRKTPE